MRRGDVTSETLDRLWLRDSEATVVTIRLTAAVGRTEVSACVRYQSREPLGKNVWVGLSRLTGHQLPISIGGDHKAWDVMPCCESMFRLLN
jgi:type VII secretion protein EccE